jgi:hypothetical protein
LQCIGKPIAIPKYIQAGVKTMDDRGQQVSEEWEEEDGVTTLLPEDGGDWWDLRRRKNDPPVDTVADLVWRWSLFESPVCFFTRCGVFISLAFMQEKMPLSKVDYYISPEDLEEHIAEIEGVREAWRRLCARYRRNVERLDENIEELRGELFHADQKELAGLKKA